MGIKQKMVDTIGRVTNSSTPSIEEVLPILKRDATISNRDLAQELGIRPNQAGSLKYEATRILAGMDSGAYDRLPTAPEPKKPTESIVGEVDILTTSTSQMSMTNMTPEDIQRRNYEILAGVKHDPPFHDRVLDFIKEAWRIVGPLFFVIFTAGEVFYYLKHFLPEDHNLWTQVLLWGITLLIEIPFMIATYDLSSRKKRALEARESGKPTRDKDTPGAIAAWAFMALVNITGQVAFLVLVTRVSLDVVGNLGIYFFIIVRVLGVLLGDAYTAFFLSPAETTISRVLRTQKAQQEGIKLLSESSMERQREESRLMLEMQRNQNTIKREQSEATFMNEFAEMNMRNALLNQQQFLQEPREQRLIEQIEPDTGAL